MEMSRFPVAAGLEPLIFCATKRSMPCCFVEGFGSCRCDSEDRGLAAASAHGVCQANGMRHAHSPWRTEHCRLSGKARYEKPGAGPGSSLRLC